MFFASSYYPVRYFAAGFWGGDLLIEAGYDRYIIHVRRR